MYTNLLRYVALLILFCKTSLHIPTVSIRNKGEHIYQMAALELHVRSSVWFRLKIRYTYVFEVSAILHQPCTNSAM